jgi:hypothetical protein
VPEVVADGDTGLLVPPLDPGALAVALARLADDAPLRRLLGAAGRRRATLYTPERVATAFLKTVTEEGLLPAGPDATVDDLQPTICIGRTRHDSHNHSRQVGRPACAAVPSL